MGGHDLIDLDQHGADEDKLTSKATTFVAACYGSKVDIYMTTRRYQMLKFKIMDPIRYGWQQAMIAQRRSQPHVQLVSLLHR